LQPHANSAPNIVADVNGVSIDDSQHDSSGVHVLVHIDGDDVTLDVYLVRWNHRPTLLRDALHKDHVVPVAGLT
jgi:hypothetical protein